MTNPWDAYPADYRTAEVRQLTAAVQAGECAAVIGLSGAGKSNLLGFLANRVQLPGVDWAWVDCNRLMQPDPAAFFRLLRQTLGSLHPADDELTALEAVIHTRLNSQPGGLCLLLDRFDALPAGMGGLASNLRALRDTFKYRLTLIIGTRPPLDVHNELAELFYAHSQWLGSLSAADARWSAASYAARRSLVWGDAVLQCLVEWSGGYPAFLRAMCEAYAGGAALEYTALIRSAPVQQRLTEFWASQPSAEAISRSGLAELPLLQHAATGADDTAAQLTAKEHLLLEYLRIHAGDVCGKDDLIRAVWPEDRVFSQGVRDDSLAQLVRRLRQKIESNPNQPRHILAITGRGYRYCA